MDIIEKIRKRIQSLYMIKKEKITEVQITKEEALYIPDRIKEIDGVKIVVVDKLGDIEKKDCFAYNEGECKALNYLYCKSRECRFYRNDINREDIENSIVAYYKYDISKR